MIIGLDFASDENSLSPHIVDIGKLTEVKIKRGVFDEIMVKPKSHYVYDSIRENWEDITYLLARFQNDLNAGNVDFINMTVQDIVVKRRKKDDLTGWTRVATIPYDKYKVKDYEFYDKYAESHQEYEYAFVPTMAQGIEGNYITADVYSEFEDTYIVDKDKSYRLGFNMSYGGSERVTHNGIFEPIGSQYPIVVSNGATNYEKGSLNALIMTDKGVDNLNRREEMEYRKELINFLTNGKPKILKNGSGEPISRSSYCKSIH